MNSKLKVVNQGFFLKKIRKELDLSGKEFADPLGFSGAYQYQLEKNAKITSRIIQKISRIYKVNIEYLETGEGEMFIRDPDEIEAEGEAKKDEVSDYKLILLESKKQTELLELQTELLKQFLDSQRHEKQV